MEDVTKGESCFLLLSFSNKKEESFLAMFNYAKTKNDENAKRIISNAYLRMRLSLEYDIGLAKKDGLGKQEAKEILMKLRSIKQKK